MIQSTSLDINNKSINKSITSIKVRWLTKLVNFRLSNLKRIVSKTKILLQEKNKRKIFIQI